ncbi:NAD(P)-dependent oxidoreductase [Bacillus sp. FJAT-50079]|uniref:precorrin-2 dehydrogenase/sirohydrochlorin ferrochelatase family protein n=1 Tax=Bacillus sp. FJAT-50079 TaxID=2833577 RepID=UPI001BC8F2B6|nr:NAD(P)-dependent oxidoreductase [Bacillus sp. FJAT-50079]MBS4209464.1 NAD(P)-dependent oxidoreductase [Bacillus sp. FJAT-50079]
MSEYVYPVIMKLKGKNVVIVGGGSIALRKARGFVGTGANIMIISPEINKELLQLPCIQWRKKEFSADDIRDAHLIFAATNNQEVNQSVCQSAHEFQWVNDTSDSENSSFITPAVVRKEQLLLTVSTSGASPILAKEIKQELEEKYAGYGKLVKEYAERREKNESNR